MKKINKALVLLLLGTLGNISIFNSLNRAFPQNPSFLIDVNGK